MNQGNTTTRPPNWEDEPPVETRVRRAPKASPRAGWAEAELPPDAAETEDASEEWVRPQRRNEKPRGPWWRPKSSFGRALLALGVLMAVGGATAAVLLTRAALERDNRFRIVGTANIQAAGLSEVSRADLLPVFGEDIGKNIFFIHLDQRRRELEAIPWVKQATVMRVLPDQIRIRVVERKPVAFAQIGGETGLVDADGVLLTMPTSEMSARHYSFPEVTGLTPSDPPEARKARMNVYMRMMAELDANGQRNSEQISEVDLSDAEDARVKMADQGGDIVAHLGEDRFLDRYQRYMRHIGEWRQQYPRLIGVDLRYDRQAVLQMEPAGQPMPSEAAQAATMPQGAPAGGQPTQNAAVTQPANPLPAATVQTKAQTAKAGLPSKVGPKAAEVTAKKGAESVAQKTTGKKGSERETASVGHAAEGKAGRTKGVQTKAGQTKAGQAKAERTQSRRAKAEKAKAEKSKAGTKAEQARSEQIAQARLHPQRRQETDRRALQTATRHKASPVAQPAAPMVEGQ